MLQLRYLLFLYHPQLGIGQRHRYAVARQVIQPRMMLRSGVHLELTCAGDSHLCRRFARRPKRVVVGEGDGVFGRQGRSGRWSQQLLDLDGIRL